MMNEKRCKTAKTKRLYNHKEHHSPINDSKVWFLSLTNLRAKKMGRDESCAKTATATCITPRLPVNVAFQMSTVI
jgi:hypothetical protein